MSQEIPENTNIPQTETQPEPPVSSERIQDEGFTQGMNELSVPEQIQDIAVEEERADAAIERATLSGERENLEMAGIREQLGLPPENVANEENLMDNEAVPPVSSEIK